MPFEAIAASLLRMALPSRLNDVMTLLIALHESASFDPLAPVDKHDNAFLSAWLRQNAPTHGDQFDFPNINVFRTFDQWTNGAVWQHSNRHQQTPLDVWLRAQDATSVYTPHQDEALAFLLQKTPLDVIERWDVTRQIPGETSFHQPSRGLTLVSYLVHRSAEQSLTVLFDRGFDLLGTQGTSSVPVAQAIRRASLWDAFLAQGGDPNLHVSHAGETVTLWEHLRDASRTYAGAPDQNSSNQLHERVMDWVKTNANDALARRERQEYWNKFGPPVHVNDLGKHMKSLPDWPTLQDDQGRTPMMRLTLTAPTTVRTFTDVQKSKPGAALLDHQGRSLWFYMLGAGDSSSATPMSQKWLSANVPVASDHQGRGLIWQIVAFSESKEPGNFSMHKALPETWDASVWKKTADRPDFWWGDETSQKNLAHWIGNEMYLGTRLAANGQQASTNRLAKVLSALVENTDVRGLHPHLLGALAAADLFEFNMDDAKMARLNKLMDAGAIINVSPERQAYLTDRHHRSSGTPGQTMVDDRVQVILSKASDNLLRDTESKLFREILGSEATPIIARPKPRL